MAEIVIPEPYASRLRKIAEQTHRPVEDVLNRLLEHYEFDEMVESLKPTSPDIPDYPPRPASSLTDDDIDVPDDIDDKAAYRTAARALRPKLYEIAREYWQETGNQERLALTDEELDKVFWVIDHEGIPRFKSERDSVVLPANPLEKFIDLFPRSDVTDASVSVRETMAKKYGRPD